MAYDESTFRRRDTESAEPVGLRDELRFRGEPGFHDEPDFRGSPSYQTGSYPAEDYSNPQAATGSPPVGRHNVSPGALDDVFDDPRHGEPGRDRLVMHLVWEAVLLVAVGGLGVLIYRDQPDALRGDQLDSLLVYGAALGLLSIGAGLSLRAGAPNLAVGPAAVIAAIYFAHESDNGALVTTGLAVAAAVAAGLLLALFVVALHVPGWAASLAAALAGLVWIQQVDGPVRVTGDYNPADQAFYLFGAFAALAILGGLLGTIKTIRRTVGRFRPVADPAQRRGGLAAALAVLAIVISMVFAAVAGVLFAAGGGRTVVPTPGLDLTGLALGAALLGGTSVFGRRGGIFGTLLAVVLITLFIRYDDVRGWDISLLAVASAVLAGGLVITRVVETYGRPRAEPDLAEIDDGVDEEEWVTTTPSGTAGIGMPSTGWGASREESWSSAGQPANGHGEPWDEDRWGTPPR